MRVSAAQKVDASVRFELWDYGKALGIELAPADEVVDAAASY